MSKTQTKKNNLKTQFLTSKLTGKVKVNWLFQPSREGNPNPFRWEIPALEWLSRQGGWWEPGTLRHLSEGMGMFVVAFV